MTAIKKSKLIPNMWNRKRVSGAMFLFNILRPPVELFRVVMDAESCFTFGLTMLKLEAKYNYCCCLVKTDYTAAIFTQGFILARCYNELSYLTWQ